MIGWLAVVIALLAWLPSFLPGAMSVIGFLISVSALLLSALSVRVVDGRVHLMFFRMTLVIVVVGVFVVNDALRVWHPLDLPLNIKVFLYGLFVVVLGLSYFLIRWRLRVE